MKSVSRKIVMILLIMGVFGTLSGCYADQNTRELTAKEENMIDTIWEHKLTWQKVSSGFDHLDCSSVEFGEYNGNTVFIARYVGKTSQFTSAALLREDCYYVSEHSFIAMDSWDEIRYRVGALYGESWSSSSTKEDLQQIYLNYLINQD